MKMLLFAILLTSVSLSAQKKNRKPLIIGKDSIQSHKKDSIKITPLQKSDVRKFYRMPSAKPKEDTQYSGLKNGKTDNGNYKILNSITPEESKKDDSKETVTIEK